MLTAALGTPQQLVYADLLLQTLCGTDRGHGSVRYGTVTAVQPSRQESRPVADGGGGGGGAAVTGGSRTLQ